jgi:hypothetical protein
MLEFEWEKSTLNGRFHIRVGEDNWTVSKRAKYSTSKKKNLMNDASNDWDAVSTSITGDFDSGRTPSSHVFFFERCVYYLTSKPGGSSTETTQYLTMAKSHK